MSCTGFVIDAVAKVQSLEQAFNSVGSTNAESVYTALTFAISKLKLNKWEDKDIKTLFNATLGDIQVNKSMPSAVDMPDEVFIGNKQEIEKLKKEIDHVGKDNLN